MSRSCRTLYVGNLPRDICKREVEDLFYKYGSVVHIDLAVLVTPPAFAFVEFEDARDAEDAIRGRDGYKFDGHRLRVELAHGGRGNSSSTDRHDSGSPGPRGRVSRRFEYRVLITGLPQSASCQDLKDHMRRAGDVSFSRVFHKGSGKTGIVDYTNSDDMKNAIKKLDDSEFRNAFSRSRIHVKEYDSSRTRSRRQRRSSSRSPFYSKGRSNVKKEGDQSEFVVDAVGDQSDRIETSDVTLRDGTTCTFTLCISKNDHFIARARPKEKLSDDCLAKRRARLEQIKKSIDDWTFVPDAMQNEGT